MKLTIIYGNGFDKNLGLNTTYPDFYKWLGENRNKENDEIYCNIKEKPENWSDLELALGEYTFSENLNSKKFEVSYESLIEDLNEYLLLEQNKLSSELSIEFALLDSIYNFEKNLKETGQNRNAQIVNQMLMERLSIQFITFNYTITLERLINQKVISFRNSQGQQRAIELTTPIHVHGILNNSMVLGVNDESQFKKDNFDTDFPEYFVKNSNLTNHVNSTELEKAMSVIDESDVIFLFGVSLGETDKKYWEKIASWLLLSDKHFVLLYDYEISIDSISKVVQRKMERKWNETKNKLLNQTDLSSDEQKRISKQIFPLYGNGFFNIEQAQKN